MSMRKFIDRVERATSLRKTMTTAKTSMAMAILLAGALCLPGDVRASDTKPQAKAQLVRLPQIETLTYESDYTVFMDAKVPAEIRRRALHKLWSMPVFNETDGLGTYAEDYTAQGVASQANAIVRSHRKTAAR